MRAGNDDHEQQSARQRGTPRNTTRTRRRQVLQRWKHVRYFVSLFDPFAFYIVKTFLLLNEHYRGVQEMMTTNNNQLGNVEHRVTQLEHSRGGSMSGTLFHYLTILNLI